MIWSEQDFEREVRRQLIELASIRKKVESDADVVRKLDKLEVSHRMLLRKISEFFKGKEAREGETAPSGPPVIFIALESYLRAIVEGQRLTGDPQEPPAKTPLKPSSLTQHPPAAPGGLTPVSKGPAEVPQAAKPSSSVGDVELDGLCEALFASGLLATESEAAEREPAEPTQDADTQDAPSAPGCEATEADETPSSSFPEGLELSMGSSLPEGIPGLLSEALKLGLAGEGIAPRMPDIHSRCATCGELLLSSLLAGDEIVLHGKTWYHRSCVVGKKHLKPGAFN